MAAQISNQREAFSLRSSGIGSNPESSCPFLSTAKTHSRSGFDLQTQNSFTRSGHIYQDGCQTQTKVPSSPRKDDSSSHKKVSSKGDMVEP